MKEQSKKKLRQPIDDHSRYLLYEDLKRRYTASAENQQQFDAAIRRAVAEAGV